MRLEHASPAARSSAESIPIRWGEFATFSETVHHLYVVHCDVENGLLYINSSNNDSVHEVLAKAVGGANAAIIRGDVVYRVLAPIKRRVPTNVGLLDAVNRKRRFSMHVGADVLEGFGPTAAQKAKTNIFAHGYGERGRVSFGASRKGRIWSHRVANTVLDWVNWAQTVGAVVTDESISIESVMEGFIIPQAATERPQLVPLGVEWPYDLLATLSENRLVSVGNEALPLHELDLSLMTHDDQSPIRFRVASDVWEVEYEMEFSMERPAFKAVSGDATIQVARAEQPLSEFMTQRGMTIFFEKEAVLSPDGYLVQPDRTRSRFPDDRLETIDWTGINIRRESQGPDRDPETVQHRAIDHLAGEADWDLIIDDDGTGEVADIVLLRVVDRTLEMTLAHCKYSSEDAPGGRLADLYEVCGQAQKSHKARSEVDLILRKLLKRERNRQGAGVTGFIKGGTTELLSIIQQSRFLDVAVTVAVVQPGLAKGSYNTPLAELLGCTELYLTETYSTGFRVICSE
ncbi:MAG: hypothetical protein GY788_08720 [bacterium]|nr:hypothetical protein [bacterium]